jgi:hypothetical protein
MSERDEKGRFQKGNRASVGNKGGRQARSREEQYYAIAMRSCSFSDWRKIWNKAAQQAIRGDKDARRFMADYLMGPPLKKVAISMIDWNNLVVDWGDDDGDNSED